MKYRAKPVEVYAKQYIHSGIMNHAIWEIIEYFQCDDQIYLDEINLQVYVQSPNYCKVVSNNDYIVRDQFGNYYTMKSAIFIATYELVIEDDLE